MGLLDDAIREHLDLKRQHGADEDELARQEAEALGPVTDDDMSTPDGTGAGESDGDGEREPGWPFDRVAENELAGEPDEPSFHWSGEDSEAEVEVPDFVPAEPPSDSALEEEPGPVDMPTQAFTAVDSLEAERADDERAGPAGISRRARAPRSRAKAPPIPRLACWRRTMRAMMSRSSQRPWSPSSPPRRPSSSRHSSRRSDRPARRLSSPIRWKPGKPEPDAPEPEPLDPEPTLSGGPGAIEEEPPHDEPPPIAPPPEHPVSVVDEPLEPVRREPDPDEGDLPESAALPVETEEPLSEPEPLEPYPLGSVEPALEPEPSAESGEPPTELGSPFEPPLRDEGLAGPADPLHPDPPGGDPPTGPDPAAEQGSPPGEPPPVEDDLGPVTQAWSIESEPGFGVPSADEAPRFGASEPEGAGSPEIAPIEERPVFEPFPAADDGPDDPLELPSDAPLELGPSDADLDPPPLGLDDAPAEPPAGARGFFEEPEEDDTLWQEERPAFDPDFEN